MVTPNPELGDKFLQSLINYKPSQEEEKKISSLQTNDTDPDATEYDVITPLTPIIINPIDAQSRTNLRIAIIGNVDSGKSTLTAALSNPPGIMDDGRGKLREKVFNFVHEKENGRTSSIAHEIIGFDKNGQ